MPPGNLLAAGRTRRARYALRRPLRGALEDLPLYAINAEGQGQRIGALALVQPEGGGSSAAGEFPKFAALRARNGSATPHILVKFSGAAGSAGE